ncbi:MAG: hypothetical protein N2260_10420 [Syntrophobacterales bacterium]|nr:hypothetical protein [Syntrophobacterales bacterium]
MERPVRTYKFNIVREIIFIIFYRKFLIATVFITFFGVFLLIAILLPSVYRSSGKFSVYVPQQLDPLKREVFYDYQARAERLLQDQKELIFSQRVLNRVVEKLEPNLSEAERSVAVSKLIKKIEVTPPRGATFKETNTFLISFSDVDPKRAQQMARLICEAYIEAFNELAKESANFSFSFYQKQVQRLYEEMIQKEREMRDYEVEHADDLIGILNLSMTPGPNMEVGPSALLTQFRARYYELKQKLAGIQVAISALENELQKSSHPAIPGELQIVGHAITAFKSKVAQLEIQLNELKAQFTSQFPAVKSTQLELQMNLESLRKELERTVQAQKVTAESISAQIIELEKVIEDLQNRVKNIASSRAAYEHLRQQYELSKQAYEKARDQMHQAELALYLEQSKQTLTYVETPSIPEKPYKPNRFLIASFGLIGGLIMALAVGATVDYFDHTIRRPEDIEEQIGIPVLTSIPKVS